MKLAKMSAKPLVRISILVALVLGLGVSPAFAKRHRNKETKKWSSDCNPSNCATYNYSGMVEKEINIEVVNKEKNSALVPDMAIKSAIRSEIMKHNGSSYSIVCSDCDCNDQSNFSPPSADFTMRDVELDSGGEVKGVADIHIQAKFTGGSGMAGTCDGNGA